MDKVLEVFWAIRGDPAHYLQESWTEHSSQDAYGPQQRDDIVKALSSGAEDYLKKTVLVRGTSGQDTCSVPANTHGSTG